LGTAVGVLLLRVARVWTLASVTVTTARPVRPDPHILAPDDGAAN
jgi:hypothetical protein